MENYYYRCPVCGYVHLVPAYWLSFQQEPTFEQMHFNKNTGEACTCLELIAMEEENS